MRHLSRLLLLASSVVVLVLVAACGGQAKLTGTELPAEQAPGFSLVDQRGQAVQLSDLQGNAVALTFIYTNCPDICPLIAQRLRMAYEQLPSKTQDKVALLAVTVDPERDTQQALQDFSEKFGLANNPRWHALTGEQAALEAVWSAYYISPGTMVQPDHEAHGSEGEHEHDASGSVGTAPATGTASPAGLLDHTGAIYLIDAKGDRRALMRSDANPKDIANNLKALAR